MLFVITSLLAGIFFRELNKKFGIPYSPLLIALGIFLGNTHQYLGQWGIATFTMEAIHPHTGMSIFVPTLVFTGALGTNFYLFKKSLSNILYLSIPGVILGSLLFGFVFKVILGYQDIDMTWMQAITLGCALTSTDPVALVALLKDFGSTSKFSTLLEGESMISGAFSMIFYYLLLDITNGQITNTFEFTVASVRLTVGGAFIGLLFGFIVSTWMKRIIKDHTLSIIITIVGSYMSFYLCEFTWLKFGGVAAVVIQGLYLSTAVKRKIYPQSSAALDTVWSTMAYSGQTVLFILLGTISGIQSAKYDALTTNDYMKMLFFWVLMILVRAIVVYSLYPILESKGYELSKKQLVVLIYGGLKGGLGLSLAMMVTVDPFYPTRYRQLATLYMEGMVIMTVLINGLTCKKVVDFVEMIHVPQIKIKLLKKCITQVLSITQKKFDQIKTEPDLKKAQWQEVQQMANLYKLGSIQLKNPDQIIESKSSVRDSIKQIHPIDLTQEIRFRFTRYLRKTYWDIYKQGELSEEAINILTEICDIANDNSQQKLAYFEHMEGAFSTDSVDLYLRFRNSWLFGPIFSRMLVSKLYFMYEVSITFVDACEETTRVFKSDFPLGSKQVGEVIQQAKQNVHSFMAFIGHLESSFPDVITAVHTKRASAILLRNKKSHLKKFFEEGFLDERQYSLLKKQIDEKLLRVNHLELGFELLRVNEVLLSYPLFESLSNSQIQKIKSQSSQKTFEKDQIILDKEKEFNSVQIVLSGTVIENFGNFSLIKGTGSVVNPYDFALKRDSKCQAKALSPVKIMAVKTEIVDQLLDNNVDFKTRWYKSLFVYETYVNQSLSFLRKSLTEKQFRRFVDSCQIRVLKTGEKDFSEFGVFVFEGEIESEGKKFSAQGQFVPKDKTFKAIKKSMVLKFGEIGLLKEKEKMRVSQYN